MIVLSRQENESFVLGNDITVTIVKIGADKVQLGVTFPPGGTVRALEDVQEADPKVTTHAQQGVSHGRAK